MSAAAEKNVRTAAAEVISELASAFADIQRLAILAGDLDGEVQGSLLAAVADMAGVGGRLADRAARALDGDPGTLALESWTESPRAIAGLRALSGSGDSQ